MRLVVLAVTGIIVLGVGGYALAQVTGPVRPAVTADVKPVPERSVKKQVAGPTKAATRASTDLEQAKKEPERDGPVLGLLWLLTGSRKR